MKDKKQEVFLIGIGPGSLSVLTAEAKSQIESCDCIVGAKRMVESLAAFGKPAFSSYLASEVKEYILTHREYQKIAVLYSGDTGFYSGAKELLEVLSEVCQIQVIPGISSIVYLAAKLRVSWEDAKLISIHGRQNPYIYEIARNKKTFLLFGGKELGKEFCQQIKAYGLEHVKIWIGQNLSYQEETLSCKKGDEITPEDLTGLTVLYIENEKPFLSDGGNIPDEDFIRGNVPLTKEEVRAVSIGKLKLHQQAVLYDVGAGTGSIGIEAATKHSDIKVYAIEKNPEGIELIQKNQRKFYVDQVEVVAGVAPAVLGELPPPTHVFIGGSSGNLKEIITQVTAKNEQVRIVINAITLETIKEVMEAAENGLLKEVEIIQMQVAKAKKLANYHMMNGENPIYIISAGGN